MRKYVFLVVVLVVSLVAPVIAKNNPKYINNRFFFKVVEGGNIIGKYSYHTVAIFSDGKVYVWGRNLEGQLGLGDTNNRLTPVENVNLENIVAQNGGVGSIESLRAGGHYNILILKNGKVYVWGSNNNGQLGLGDTNDRITPVENTELENIIAQNDGVGSIQWLYVGWRYNILVLRTVRFMFGVQIIMVNWVLVILTIG